MIAMLLLTSITLERLEVMERATLPVHSTHRREH
jgi:hypothetical protein